MLQTAQAIVLRSIKYGETSLVTTLFTDVWGVQAYLVNGVRKNTRQQRAGLLQPCSILDIVGDQRPLKNLLRLREFQPAFYYKNLPEHVLRNSVGLFIMEFVWRLLPEQAPYPELFAFTTHVLEWIDEIDESQLGIMPLYFSTRAAALAGYEIYDHQSDQLVTELQLQDAEAEALKKLLQVREESELLSLRLPPAIRKSLLHRHLYFLQNMVSGMQSLKTLPVLEIILHN